MGTYLKFTYSFYHVLFILHQIVKDCFKILYHFHFQDYHAHMESHFIYTGAFGVCKICNKSVKRCYGEGLRSFFFLKHLRTHVAKSGTGAGTKRAKNRGVKKTFLCFECGISFNVNILFIFYIFYFLSTPVSMHG